MLLSTRPTESSSTLESLTALTGGKQEASHEYSLLEMIDHVKVQIIALLSN